MQWRMILLPIVLAMAGVEACAAAQAAPDAFRDTIAAAVKAGQRRGRVE